MRGQALESVSTSTLQAMGAPGARDVPERLSPKTLVYGIEITSLPRQVEMSSTCATAPHAPAGKSNEKLAEPEPSAVRS